MKKKRKLLMIISIIILTICIIPNNVIAEEKKPDLIWEKEDIKTDFNYTGTKILCGTGNGYIAVDSNGEIARYNADGEKVNVIVTNTSNVNSAIIDGDNLVFTSSDGYLKKYKLDGTLVYQKEINNMITIVNGNDGYYIQLGYNKISKYDKDGNFIKSKDFGGDFDNFIYVENANKIVVLDGLNIIVLDGDLNLIEEKEDVFSFSSHNSFIRKIDDGYIRFDVGEPLSLMKLNENFEIVWEKEVSLDMSSLSDIDVLADGYILVGGNDEGANLIKLDKDGNILYEESYDNGYKRLSFDKIVMLDNSDYIIHCNVGAGSAYTEYNGSVILKYGYKDYNITTNIKGGGVIDSTLDTAKEGDKVTFNATPKDGYELKSIKVVTVSGKVIEVTDNSFIMPDEDVVIEGEFVKTLTENPKTGNIIMIIIGIGVILILGTITTIYYKIKKDRT